MRPSREQFHLATVDVMLRDRLDATSCLELPDRVIVKSDPAADGRPFLYWEMKAMPFNGVEHLLPNFACR